MPKHIDTEAPEQINALILCAVSTPEQAADEKQSLDTQERELRAIAAARNWNVIKVLYIPGFSRDYISWEECAADMLKANPPITAMAELKNLCTPANGRPIFQVFMVRDADRFGRTQSLIMQIAETICVRLGLKIYSQMDNQLVEGLQSRFWAAMTGLRAAGDQDKRKKYLRDGVARRAANGLLVGTWEPFTHFKVYDEKHKVVGTAVREERRYLFDAVYKLVVEERVAMADISRQLTKLGYVNPETNKPFREYFWYRILYYPATWGHVLQYFDAFSRGGYDGEWHGLWGLGPEYGEPPDPMKIHYDVIPAVWTGMQGETMKAELRRRKMMSGGRRPQNTHALSGLLICGGCGYTMMFARNREWRAYRCITDSVPRFQERAECPVVAKSIRTEEAMDWIYDELSTMLSHQDDEYFRLRTDENRTINQLERSEQLLGEINQRINNLIAKQANARPSLAANYDQQLDALAEQKEALEQSIIGLRVESRSVTNSGRRQAIDELREMTIAVFRNLSEPVQHQLLERIFDGYRIVVVEGEITGYTKKPPHLRNKSRGKRYSA